MAGDKSKEGVEGEGSYSATRDYQKNMERFQKGHPDTRAMAEDARREVEKNPDEFERAEREGKKPARH